MVRKSGRTSARKSRTHIIGGLVRESLMDLPRVEVVFRVRVVYETCVRNCARVIRGEGLRWTCNFSGPPRLLSRRCPGRCPGSGPHQESHQHIRGASGSTGCCNECGSQLCGWRSSAADRPRALWHGLAPILHKSLDWFNALEHRGHAGRETKIGSGVRMKADIGRPEIAVPSRCSARVPSWKRFERDTVRSNPTRARSTPPQLLPNPPHGCLAQLQSWAPAPHPIE